MEKANEKLLKKYTDDSGYYTGYCQCNCDACKYTDEGKHCQGTICKGD